MVRKTTMARVRKGRQRSRESGFIVTWDVDSKDRPTTAHVYRFVYGDTTRANGRTYRYPGFVEKEGVRYLGQSVLFAAKLWWRKLTDSCRTQASTTKRLPRRSG